MNIRQFTFAVLISALPVSLPAEARQLFNEGDFKTAKQSSPDGETQLTVKLSKSGKAKLKRLQDQ